MSLPPERELIERLTAAATVERNRAGFDSDCAIVDLGGTELVATIDTFAADTHFPPGTPPSMAAHLATAAAMSDLAAAAADVLGLLVGYAIPPRVSEAQVDRMGRTVAELVEAHGGEVLGGDTKPRDQLELSIAALGTAPNGTALTRRGASPGDRLVVSGPLGGAGAALERVQAGLEPRQAEPLLSPTPRIDAGRALRDVGASCCVDLSDGLADGAVAIAEASDVRVVLDAEAIPLHPWAKGQEEGRAWALSTGGDYELLAAIPEAGTERLVATWEALDLDPAVVGRVEAGGAAVLEEDGQERVLSRGYEHRFDA